MLGWRLLCGVWEGSVELCRNKFLVFNTRWDRCCCVATWTELEFNNRDWLAVIPAEKNHRDWRQQLLDISHRVLLWLLSTIIDHQQSWSGLRYHNLVGVTRLMISCFQFSTSCYKNVACVSQKQLMKYHCNVLMTHHTHHFCLSWRSWTRTTKINLWWHNTSSIKLSLKQNLITTRQ